MRTATSFLNFRLKYSISICLLTLGSLLMSTMPAFSQQDLRRPVAVPHPVKAKEIQYPALVKAFYDLNDHKLFWLQPGEQAKNKRAAFKRLLEACSSLGLNAARYNRSVNLSSYDDTNITGVSGQELLNVDMIITDAALSLCKDLYQGAMMKNWVSYDEISRKCAAADDISILKALVEIKTDQQLLAMINTLEPQGSEYAALKKSLATAISNGNQLNMKQLISSMNFYRWVHHFRLGQFVVVNIGSATVKYYHADTVQLDMKAVVGTTYTRTPRFASYCSQVVLYPYWNVPRSIAISDLLPRFKRSPAMLELLNMEVLDRKGNVVNPKNIKWASLNRTNFPYRFREMTGCVNPLGVVKFDITDPFSVYIHDTNFKGAFLAKNRYYSHGCIRVEEPVALATALLEKQVDTTFLQACYKDMQPVILKLPQPVPVFVVYMTAEVDSTGVVQYFKDPYKLL